MSFKSECERAKKQGIKNSQVCKDKNGKFKLGPFEGSKSTSICGKCK